MGDEERKWVSCYNGKVVMRRRTSSMGLGIRADAKVVPSEHFKKQMVTKGFDWSDVVGALKSPYKVTDVQRYPGQKRFCGSGLAVIVSPQGEKRFLLVTVYLDGVVTPLRADQLDDPEAVNSARVRRGT